jgi:hypothetical protein
LGFLEKRRRRRLPVFKKIKAKQMKSIISLIIGVIAVINVVYSFWKISSSQAIFGIEMNNWIYRLVWSAIAVIFLYDYYKKTKLRY